jgi:DNA-binding ferritin-like protein
MTAPTTTRTTASDRDAVDEIAERIRTLGPLAPGSCREVARLARLADRATVDGAGS